MDLVMRRSLVALLLSLGVATLSFAAPAAAQSPGVKNEKCPEGRTAAGKCANRMLSSAMRQITIVMTQPKLSYTGMAIRQDTGNYSGSGNSDSDRRQELKYETAGAVPPSPPPGTFVRLPPSVNPATLQIAAPFTVVTGGILIK
jgi:hypothetical protein